LDNLQVIQFFEWITNCVIRNARLHWKGTGGAGGGTGARGGTCKGGPASAGGARGGGAKVERLKGAGFQWIG